MRLSRRLCGLQTPLLRPERPLPRCQLARPAGPARSGAVDWRACPASQRRRRFSPRLFAALVCFSWLKDYIIPFFRPDFAAEAPPNIACRDVPRRAAMCRGVCPERCFWTCRGQVCLTKCRGNYFGGPRGTCRATCRDVPRRAVCFLQSSPCAEKS